MNTSTDMTQGIPVNASAFPIYIEITGTGSGKEKQNLTPDGRKHYALDAALRYVKSTGDESLLPKGQVWISSIEPCEHVKPHPFMKTILQAQGKAWIKPYSAGDGQSFTICAERWVQVDLQKLMEQETKAA